VGVTSADDSQTFIEEWRDHKWTFTPSPDAPDSTYDELAGVSCVSSASCQAVGSFTQGTSGPTRIFVESWNGTRWTLVHTPSVGSGSAANSDLNSISCVTSSFCMAAGSYWSTGPFGSLVEEWNGASWSVVSKIAGKGSNEVGLDAVSCSSSMSCMAVGIALDRTDTYSKTLAEIWNGKTWAVVPIPTKSYAELLGISCPVLRSCEAVGIFSSASTTKTLIESWNGAEWSVAPSPSIGVLSVLRAVACATPTSCGAVGFYSKTTASIQQSLVESS
jgi:hypothetical protein